MSYEFITRYNSPNHGGAVVPNPANLCIVHWWGAPSGQTFEGTISWLCNPASQVSAHAVATAGKIACIVDYPNRSWANGNDWANNNAITVECDPNDIDGTIATLVEWLADMVRQNNLTADFQLKGHRDFYATECPGAYYPRLGEIRGRVAEALGRPAPAPSDPVGIRVDLPDWNLPAGHFYGHISGGEDSHGGYYPAERPAIKGIQLWLIRHGYAGNVSDAWADGIFEQPTVDAVTRFQRAERPTSTDRWGEVWADDLATMSANNG
ncbi:MAG: N-acetylmuramoyl-L-alanine amidase [Propionibacterium freudenreichii]